MVPLMEVLTQQLEYYFSVENLCRDIFLRGKMNGKGYIDIDVLGSFNRLRYLTDNIDFLLKAARKSELLKVKNRAVRARKNWHQWTFPPQLDMMNEPDSSDEEVEEEETETETPQEQEQSKEQTQEQEEEKEAVSDKGDEKEHLNVKEVAKEENTETEPEKAATITTTEKKEEEKTDDTEVESK